MFQKNSNNNQHISGKYIVGSETSSNDPVCRSVGRSLFPKKGGKFDSQHAPIGPELLVLLAFTFNQHSCFWLSCNQRLKENNHEMIDREGERHT